MNIFLNKIENNFKLMVETGKVDLSVINDLEEFKKDLINSNEKIIKKKNSLDFFPLFHTIETQIRILNHMIYRVKIAPEIKDNPKVADDALLIIPHLKFINDSLEEDKDINPHQILRISTKLQSLAMKNNMYPPSNEIIKSSQDKSLKENFERFILNIGEEIERI